MAVAAMKQRFNGGPFGGQTLEVGSHGSLPVLILVHPRPTYEHAGDTEEHYELIGNMRYHKLSRPTIAFQVKARKQ